MAERIRTIARIIDVIRTGAPVTRPELVRQLDLGRNVVNQRVQEAIDAGLLVEEDRSISTGGRPSKVLRIDADRGHILSAMFGASRLHIALTDLTGTVVADAYSPWDIAKGPVASMAYLLEAVRRLIDGYGRAPLWGASIGLPAPVDFGAARPVSPPIMPGWDSVPVGSYLESTLQVPTWIDNDVNLMALGTWRSLMPSAGDDVLLIKVGTGIGAGLISRGRLHRGARGAAGDFGHTVVNGDSPVLCRCGNFGCLEAVAGGWALARDATVLAREGQSAFLERRLGHAGALTVDDVVDGALAGDATCNAIVARAATTVGRQLATFVSFFNPKTVYLGGSVAQVGPPFLDGVREAVRERALPLATEELQIELVPLDHYEGVIGAAALALDEIYSPALLARWFDRSSPHSLRLRDAASPVPAILAGTEASGETPIPPMRSLARTTEEEPR